MQPVECEFEAEVLSAVLQSRWPERADPALQAHVADCTICSDVAAVAGVIEDAREEMRAEVIVPDSGRVWRGPVCGRGRKRRRRRRVPSRRRR